MRFGEVFEKTGFAVVNEGSLDVATLLEVVAYRVTIPHYQRELIENYKSSAKKLTAFFAGDLGKAPILFSRVAGEKELNLHDGLQRVGNLANFFVDAGRVFELNPPETLRGYDFGRVRKLAREVLFKLGVARNFSEALEKAPRWRDFKEFLQQVYGMKADVEGLKDSDRITIGKIEEIDPGFAEKLYTSMVAYRVLEFPSTADEVAHFIRLNKVGDPLSSVHVSLLLLGEELSKPIKWGMNEIKHVFRGTRGNKSEAHLKVIMYVLMNTWDIENGRVVVKPEMITKNDQGKHYEAFAAELRRHYESLDDAEKKKYYRAFERAVGDIVERVLTVAMLKDEFEAAGDRKGIRALTSASFMSMFVMGVMDYPLYALKGKTHYGDRGALEKLREYYELVSSVRNIAVYEKKYPVFIENPEEFARNERDGVELRTPVEALNVPNSQNSTKRREIFKGFLYAAETVYGVRKSVQDRLRPKIRRAVLGYVKKNRRVIRDPYSGRTIDYRKIEEGPYEIDHPFGWARDNTIVTVTSRRNNRGKGISNAGEEALKRGTFFRVWFDAGFMRVLGVEEIRPV